MRVQNSISFDLLSHVEEYNLRFSKTSFTFDHYPLFYFYLKLKSVFLKRVLIT